VASDTIGFVGIGNAGWPMAARLIEHGHRVIVYDIDLDRVERFAAEHGSPGARTPDELADVGVLFTSVFDGHGVRDLLLGGGRLADRLRPGTVVIDTSSADPIGTRELGEELAGRGIHLVDAGVSMHELGGRESGRICFMVGGDDEDAVERAVALLGQIGERVFPLGRLGAGHAMKTLNNYVSACGLMAALDALIVGFRYGLDPAAMLDVLNVSTGRNFSTEQTLKYESLPRTFETGYTIELLVKDLGIAAGLAESVEFESPLFRLVVERFAEARADIGGESDLTASLRHWEHRAGEELPASAATSRSD
jgi:3-hydroxyisobutyrate dehydrogenase